MSIRKICILILIGSLPLIANSQNDAKPAFENLKNFVNIRDFSLSPSGIECFFTAQSPLEEMSSLLAMNKENGTWREAELLPFTGKYKDLEPFISHDGLTLYFVSNRPLNNENTAPKDFDIWYVKRKSIKDQWGDPINLGAPVNTENNEFYPSLSLNNNLYFCSDNPISTGKDDVFVSTYKNGIYDLPRPLSDAINTEGFEFNAFIAPDESYIIFGGYNRSDGMGSGDMYISFRSQNNDWSTPQNLGSTINSKSMDYCPFYDTATQTLFFTSKRSSINTVTDFKTMEDLKNEYNKYENGLSRLYFVKFDPNSYRP